MDKLHVAIRRMVMIFVVTLLFALVLSPGVQSAPMTAAEPTLSVIPNSGPAGTGVTLSGGNWQVNIDATIRWDGADRSSFHIGSSGSFTTPFTIPAEAGAGVHTVTVCLGVPCFTGEFYVGRNIQFTVVPPTAVTPPTTIGPTWTPFPIFLTTPTHTSTPTELPIVRPLPSTLPYQISNPFCNPPGSATIIDFDDIPPGGRTIDYSFPGVFFLAAGRGMIASVPGMGAYSAPMALKHDPGASEFGSMAEEVNIQFTRPQHGVGMYVGLDDTTEGPIAATLTAFDAEGHGIAVHSVTLGPGPTSVNMCMMVRQPDDAGPNPQIVTVTLSYDGAAGEVLDHLYFYQTPASARISSGELDVDLRAPVDGTELLSLRQDIWGVVRSSERIRYIELWENYGLPDQRFIGGPNISYDPATRDRIFWTRRSSLSPNVQSITAIAFTEYGHAEDTINVHPADYVQIAAIQNFDVRITAIEVTQGVRGDIPIFTEEGQSLADTVVHVADRKTVVRVYPELLVTSGTFSGSLSARLIGTRSGVTLPGSPLTPENPELEIDPSWSLTDMRSDASRSWNFVLPDAWIAEGTISLTIEVNPPGPYFRPECPDCGNNNLNYLTRVRFQPTSSVSFYPYLIVDHPQNDGSTTPGVTASWGELLNAYGWVLRLWPIPDNGLDIQSVIRLSSDCIPGSPQNTTPVDRYTGLPCDTLNSAILAARARVSTLGIQPGDASLFPLLLDNNSSRGCAGLAGLRNPVYWATVCGPVLAHESWHAGGGFNHAGNAHGELAGGGNDPSYPSNHGAVEVNAYGFDIFGMQAIPPTSGGVHTHDFMSYGWLGNPSNAWISIYSWQNIFSWLQTNALSAQMQQESNPPSHAQASYSVSLASSTIPVMRISGQINPDGTASLNPIFLGSVPGEFADQEGEGSYRLELWGENNNLLYIRRFEAIPSAQPESGPLEFYENIPSTLDVVRVILVKDDTELARLTATRASPQVNLLSPSDGEHWEAIGQAELVWEAADSDGDELMFLVEASPDRGETWMVLATTNLSQMTLDLSSVPGGGGGWHVRVQASDGLNIGVSETGGISVEFKPPQAFILVPYEDQVFEEGASLMLNGLSADFQDGQLPDAALEWSVDGAVIGHGARWPVFGLDLGEHTVTLRATNKAGLVGEMQVTFRVGEGGNLLDTLRQPLYLIAMALFVVAVAAVVFLLVRRHQRNSPKRR